VSGAVVRTTPDLLRSDGTTAAIIEVDGHVVDVVSIAAGKDRWDSDLWGEWANEDLSNAGWTLAGQWAFEGTELVGAVARLVTKVGTCPACGTTVVILDYMPAQGGRSWNEGYIGGHYRPDAPRGTRCPGSFGDDPAVTR